MSKQSAVESNSKYIYDSTKRETSLLQIRNYSDIKNKIIPFFNQYPILGVKSLDYADFKVVAELVNNKEHLTDSGFRKIINIVEHMNLSRKISTSPFPEGETEELEDKT